MRAEVPLFVPADLVSTLVQLVQLVRGRHPCLDHCFERGAYAKVSRAEVPRAMEWAIES